MMVNYRELIHLSAGHALIVVNWRTQRRGTILTTLPVLDDSYVYGQRGAFKMGAVLEGEQT